MTQLRQAARSRGSDDASSASPGRIRARIVVMAFCAIAFGFWLLGVLTQFLTGVRLDYGFMIWGLLHRKELREASICGCHKGEAVWGTLLGIYGEPQEFYCMRCGRYPTAEEHQFLVEHTRRNRSPDDVTAQTTGN